MNVGAIAAIGSSGAAGAVYAASPYLNGVVRTPAAEPASTSTPVRTPTPVVAATIAPAANTATTATAPFANPAIADIGNAAAVRASIAAATLSGDAGELVQSYGAVALLVGPVVAARAILPPVSPAVPPVAPIARIAALPPVRA